jgi:hypothetical protein
MDRENNEYQLCDCVAAKDAFGYSLHYNNDDYKSIGSAAFLNRVTNNEFANAGDSLFNGNISKMATAISGMQVLGKIYKQ